MTNYPVIVDRIPVIVGRVPVIADNETVVIADRAKRRSAIP
jgi:hypothetical protein